MASSHCHIASKNITKKKHRKKTKNNKKNFKKTTHAKTPNASGGEALRPPPQPPSSLFFLRLPPLTATLLQRTSRRKNTGRRQKITKKTKHAKTPHASGGGRRCALPPTPPPAFSFKVASSHCHIASKNITKKKHKKKTKMTEKHQHMQRHPMHLGGRRCALPTKNDRKKHKCKDAQCIFRRTLQKQTTNAKTPDASGGEAPLTHTSRRKYTRIRKNTEKTRFPSCFFVLKLPCLDVETDAKNPRQAGTVAKKTRGTDAKNPPQLAPLQKTPLQSEMSPP